MSINHMRLLRAMMVVTGVGFFGIVPMAIIWPSGWSWHEGGPLADDYFLMIVGIYAVLGLFLILAARNPPEHRSLIWFTVWSSVVHGLIMLWEASRSPFHRGHLIGDAPALLLLGLLLGLVAWRAVRGPAQTSTRGE